MCSTKPIAMPIRSTRCDTLYFPNTCAIDSETKSISTSTHNITFAYCNEDVTIKIDKAA